jgi:hypothetical protein
LQTCKKEDLVGCSVEKPMRKTRRIRNIRQRELNRVGEQVQTLYSNILRLSDEFCLNLGLF